MDRDNIPEPLKVSVHMITYNHEAYIARAIDGVLMQKTNFRYELVIGEDHSTDETMSICRKYADTNPGIIRILPSERNLGMMPNANRTTASCNGKYIAFCEGDDYWIDPYKLQKQVDYLEDYADTGMVCTSYKKYYQKEDRYSNDCFNFRLYGNEIKFSEYMLDMSSISTATVMIRNDIIRQYGSEIPEKLRNDFIVGDTPLWLFTAAKTRIAVIPDETAVYRILDNSACHFRRPEDHYKFVLKGFKMADYFYERYGGNDPVLLERIKRKKHKAALFHGYRSMNSTMARESFKKLMTSGLSLKQKISAWIMLTGSYNKVLNRIAGAILKVNQQILSR